MESGNQLLLLLLIVVLVGTFVYQMIRNRVTEPQRSEAIGAFAAEQGLDLQATAPISFVKSYTHFPYFKASAAKEVRNVLTGEVEGRGFSAHNFVAFDYQFMKKVHGAYRRTSQTETVVIVDVAGMDLPTFALVEPRTLEPPIAHYQVFDTTGLHRMEGIDEGAVRSLLTNTVVSHAPVFSCQGQGNQLLFYRTWKRSNPADLVQEIHGCVAFAQLLADQLRGNAGSSVESQESPKYVV